MKRFLKSALCTALAFIITSSVAIPCFAETSNCSTEPEESQVSTEVFNEYDYIVEMRGYTDSELTADGLSAEEIEDLRSDSVEEELLARRELSDEKLINNYGYTEEKIEILRNYDGGRLEDHEELRSIFAELSFSDFEVVKAKPTRVTVSIKWKWDACPVWCTNDVVVAAWRPAFGADNGLVRLNPAFSNMSVDYVGNYTHRDYYFFSDEDLDPTYAAKIEFPMSMPYSTEYSGTYGREGKVLLTVDKAPNSPYISELDFVFSYGHSRCVVSGISVGVDTASNGSFSISFGWATVEQSRKYCCVNVNPFVDVDSYDYYYNAVMWALDKDAAGGIDDTHFGSQQEIKRRDVVMLLWSIMGRPAPGNVTNPFKDVKSTDYYYDAVMWAVKKGYVGGVDPTHFGQNELCSRSEVLQILYAFKGKPTPKISNPYSDVKNKHWFKNCAIWAYDAGVERGENGCFNPKRICTRADVIMYLYRAIAGKDTLK